MIDLRNVSKEVFDPCLDQDFETNIEGIEISLKLTKCELSKNGPHDGSEKTRHPFFLEFTGTEQPQLPQGSFEFANKTLGQLSIFLVPIAPGTYQAVFN